jgi:predicted phosphoribosyltransferase
VERFRSRAEAGRLLAVQLVHHCGAGPLVVGLAGGGVAVAAAVAGLLAGSLAAVASVPFGPPGNPDLAVGAVSADGVPVVEAGLVARLGLSPAELAEEAAVAAARARRQERVWRQRRTHKASGRVVIVVDDGVGSGLRMRAVLARMRRAGAATVVCAVPVGPPATIDLLAAEADEMVGLCQPLRFHAVADWYEDFPAVGDQEVVALLRAARG